MSDDTKFLIMVGAPFLANLLSTLASLFTHRNSRAQVGEIHQIIRNGHELKKELEG